MIEIADEHLREIRAHGERDYPLECCGLLIGRFDGDSKVVLETYPISNAREEAAKRNRFLIRPEELMRGEKYAREKGAVGVSFEPARELAHRRDPQVRAPVGELGGHHREDFVDIARIGLRVKPE